MIGRLSALFVALLLAGLAGGRDAKNVTVSVPAGATYHEGSHVLCTPFRWYDMIIFYAGNYFAHAVTVRSYPGESTASKLYVIALALLLPHSGLNRGILAIKSQAIFYGPLFGGDELRMAARAGALCMVVRLRKWEPSMAKGTIRNVSILRRKHDVDGKKREKYTKNFELAECKTGAPRYASSLAVDSGEGLTWLSDKSAIHGIHRFPENLHGAYGFALVPRDANVAPNEVQQSHRPIENREITMSPTFDGAGALVAIVQIIFGSVTLYRTRANEIARFGYAAFGLTVLPYLIMSFMNLVGNILTPNYSTLYLVRSNEMDEVEALGGYFEGVVGRVNNNVPNTEGTDATVHEDGQSLNMSALPASIKPPRAGDSTGNDNDSLPQYEGMRQYCFAVTDERSDIRVLIRPISPFEKRHASRSSRYSQNILATLLVLMATATPFAVNGALTSFQKGGSTTAERVLTMLWLCWGICLGSIYGSAKNQFVDNTIMVTIWSIIFTTLLLGAPSIGGFVVVGKMLTSFGNCVVIGQ